MPDQPRHLLDIDCLDDSDLHGLIDRACALAGGAQPQVLDRTVTNLFFEPSTRTRISFELAASRLGMRVINMELDRSSTAKGEGLEDTVATLAAMGVDCIVFRHADNGRCRGLVDAGKIVPALINAGEGTTAHPSQALLDAATLRSRGMELSGLRLAIIGDVRHSRVAASGLALWSRLGVEEVRLAGPEGMMPEDLPLAGVRHCRNLEEAVADVDVIMMLRVQRERIDRAGWPDPEHYHRQWGLQSAHLEHARPGCVVMHPGPINRGMEIAAEVADGEHSLILEQVRMGVFMRMAIFEWVFA